ncbi:F0F1 ATP synthase subunit B family protein [Shumkonia mesophila]|uniref:F0F1 ATP synthase subunit B family protein n=1 Tax=Shumkonia mesophila TaxID=2838854 RepID=UPI00293531E0|nr:F0F1 ATP synthase subunit B [Shumkonia mesophila]
MQAWAAETAGTKAEAFWATPEFWVAIAFVILVALAGRAVLRLVTTGLDARADAIRARVNEAEKLREEAQELLASYQRKQREAAEETSRLLEHARQEAATLSARAAESLEQSVKRREQLAMERIAQAEATATREIRDAAVDVALEATRRVLAEKLSETKADELIDDAIKGLPGKLH